MTLLKKTPLPFGCGVLLILLLVYQSIYATPLKAGIISRASSKAMFAFNKTGVNAETVLKPASSLADAC